MIRVEHVSKIFETGAGPIRAVDDVSFHVARGEVYGIIGLSGAGKSTLVRLLNRLEEPSQGKILIDGVDILSLSGKALLEERKAIGMIFQHFNLFAQKTIRENIAYPLRISGRPRAQIKKRVDELIDFIGLEERAESYPAELSGGQQQRVAIARALATEPKILLSDEGTSALDPKNTKQVLDLLDKVRQEFGTTIIMITHQMEVARAICQRIAVMEKGKMVEEGKTQDIFLKPRHPVTRSFLTRSKARKEMAAYRKVTRGGELLRLSYRSKSVSTPIISDLVKKYQVSVSILAGDADCLNKEDIGYLIVEILGDPQQVDRAVQDLLEQDVEVEVDRAIPAAN